MWDLDHVFGQERIQVSPVLDILPPLIVDDWTDRPVGRGELGDNEGVALFLLLNHHWQLGMDNFYIVHSWKRKGILISSKLWDQCFLLKYTS